MKCYFIQLDLLRNQDDNTSPTSWTDKRFVKEAIRQGGDYSLIDFQVAFNDEEINANVGFIRFMKEEAAQ